MIMGVFSAIAPAHAGEWSSTFQLPCTADARPGGRQVTCVSSQTIRGQAWKWEYRPVRMDDPPATVDVCINNVGIMNAGGYCWNIQRRESGFNALRRDGAINPEDMSQYKYFVAQIITRSSFTNDNNHTGGFTYWGRAVSINSASVSPGSINFGGQATISWSGEFANRGELWLREPDMGGGYAMREVYPNPPGGGSGVGGLFSDSYLYTNGTIPNAAPGSVYALLRLWGPGDPDGNYTSLEVVPDIEVQIGENAPGNFTLSGPACSGGANPIVGLNWSQSSNATSYEVWRCEWSLCFNRANIATIAGTAYVDTSVAAGIDYYYTIRARNSAGSAESNQREISTAAQNCGGPPLTHSECQSNACVVVLGAGADGCQTDGDCRSGGGGTERVYGYVFIDANQSGARDGGEGGLAGRTVYIRSIPGNNVLNSDVTDGSGFYEMYQAGSNEEVRIQHPIPPGYQGTTDWSFIRAIDQVRRVDFGVVPAAGPASCSFSADPSRVIIPPAPARSALSWDCQNVRSGSCSITGVGGVGASGNAQVALSFTRTYTLSCLGDDGTPVNRSTTIRVYSFEGGQLREILPYLP